MKRGGRNYLAHKVPDTDEVTDSYIASVYRLDKPSCSIGACESVCKSLPRCLNGLSRLELPEESDSAGESSSPTSSYQSNSIGRNGLKNYGNTCYLNAFLQLYFRFGKLRRAVYSLPAEYDETGVIRQLQEIFSQLQLSRNSVVDPGGLIQVLGLCEEEQQDAPEFHCLFMNLLEARFRESGISVVENLLRGEYVYETKCTNCGFTSERPSSFLELSLKVSSTSLAGCIKDYFKNEPLIGENQYACPQCLGKHDGVRKAYITKAPSLLCIQLLRFTYDSRTGQRKKQKALVRLPDTLELLELPSENNSVKSIKPSHSVMCLAPNNGGVSSRLYRLHGVLLHIGSQPTSGHYLAVVRDAESVYNANSHESMDPSDVAETLNEYWTVCDDMEVHTVPSQYFNLAKVNGNRKALQSATKINAVKTSTVTDDDDDAGNVNSSDVPFQKDSPNKSISFKSKRRRLNQSTLAAISESELPLNAACDVVDVTHDSVRWHSSSVAYMIFYQAVDDDHQNANISVPEHLRSIVEQVNSTKLDAIREQREFKQTQSQTLLAILEELLYPNETDQMKVEDTFSLISTTWLSDWLNHPEQPALAMHPAKSDTTASDYSLAHSSEQRSDQSNETGYRLSLCPHGRLPTDLNSFTYRAVSSSGLIRALESTESKAALESYRTNAERFRPCLDCVSLNLALQRLECSIRSLSKEMDCFARNLTSGNSKKTTNPSSSISVELPSESKSAPQPEFYWIGRRSIRQWRNMARRYTRFLHSTEDGLTENGESRLTCFNADVACIHGNLKTNTKEMRRIPASLWNRLLELFPGASVLTFPAQLPISDDDRVGSENFECKDCELLCNELIERANSERQTLPDLFTCTYRNLSDFSQNCANLDTNCTEGVCNASSTDVYLIPSDFVVQWRRFIRNPAPETVPSHLPSGLTASGVLCKHDQLRIPVDDLIAGLLLFPVTTSEFFALSKTYASQLHSSYLNDNEQSPDNADSLLTEKVVVYPPIFLVPDPTSPTGWNFCPPDFSLICSECHKNWLTEQNSFQNARLRIRLMDSAHEAFSSSYADLPQSDLDDTVVNENGELSTNENDPAEVTDSNCSTANVPNDYPNISENLSTTEESITGERLHTTDKVVKTSVVKASENIDRTKLCFVRRSTRQRVNPNDIIVYASSENRLQHLKVQLMQVLGATPADQHIVYKGIELSDDSKTLQTLGISANSQLYLWTDGPVWRANDADSLGTATGRSTSNGRISNAASKTTNVSSNCSLFSTPIEIGFKGTRLLDN